MVNRCWAPLPTQRPSPIDGHFSVCRKLSVPSRPTSPTAIDHSRSPEEGEKFARDSTFSGEESHDPPGAHAGMITGGVVAHGDFLNATLFNIRHRRRTAMATSSTATKPPRRRPVPAVKRPRTPRPISVAPDEPLRLELFRCVPTMLYSFN